MHEGIDPLLFSPFSFLAHSLLDLSSDYHFDVSLKTTGKRLHPSEPRTGAFWMLLSHEKRAGVGGYLPSLASTTRPSPLNHHSPSFCLPPLPCPCPPLLTHSPLRFEYDEQVANLHELQRGRWRGQGARREGRKRRPCPCEAMETCAVVLY